ncbi:MAG TPA: aldose epimerase family protein [Lactovum miscens]|uniref:aldose epimerase family protein n=1 Tax=Lactovum miscens TaxID=190387 RepID=UPI002ED8D443
MIKTEVSGEKGRVYTITNKQQVSLTVANFGARIMSIQVPVMGASRELVVGFANLKDYQKTPYFGATIGRTAGRIEGGKFTIAGQTFDIDKNEQNNTLHGGANSLESKYWKGTVKTENSVIFTFLSPDGENGYPGNLHLEVSYTLTDENQLIIDYHALADKDTLFNPTNHVYFNLTGSAEETIESHYLEIKSDRYLELNPDNTASGTVHLVKGTVFDFNTLKEIKEVVQSDDAQIALNQGLNHPFLLIGKQESFEPNALLVSPDKKVSIEMKTSQNSVIVYTTGNAEAGLLTQTGSLAYHGAIALEAQMPPGSEVFSFQSNIWLRKAQPYNAWTSYKILS